jgi:hypothetical protein
MRHRIWQHNSNRNIAMCLLHVEVGEVMRAGILQKGERQYFLDYKEKIRIEGQQSFSVKSQIANTLGFIAHP